MIAACPKCQAKYRVDAARLSPDGARLRCAKCQAVFRVRAPAAAPVEQPVAQPVAAPPRQAEAASVTQAPGRVPGQAPDQPAAPDVDASIDRDKLIVIADPDVESGKAMLASLASWGLQPVLVHDGVEALLTIQRMLPRAAILDAALPKMYGFQICEMVKRNESLRSMHIVLVGSVHHQDRYRRPPSELYGADLYMEKPTLPEGLAPALTRFGYTLTTPAAAAAPTPTPAPEPAPPIAVTPPVVEQPVAAPQPVVEEPVAPAAPVPPVGFAPEPEPAAPPSPAPAEPVAAPEPVAPLQPAAVPEPTVAPEPAAAAPAAAPAADGLAEQRANAERLARIIVSDILLYHPEQFEAGLAGGNLAEALDSAIQEGRGFFAQRVDPSVRDERDFILDELARIARERGGQ